MGRTSKATLRRQEILSHFYEVIIEEGFEGASIAKIAKRMEVNPSLLIHYFSTKDTMVLGLIDYIIDTYSSQLIPDFSTTEDPNERWEDVLDVISRIQWDRIMDNVVFYSCYTLTFRNDEVKKRFNDLYRGITHTIAYELEFAKRAGIIQVKHPIRLAEIIVSLIEGFNYFQHVSPLSPDNEARAERIKGTIRALCQGQPL